MSLIVWQHPSQVSEVERADILPEPPMEEPEESGSTCGGEREETRDHDRNMGSIQQQSGEEAISYAKSQSTEPGHEKLL